MRNLRRTALSLVLAVALLGAMAVPALAGNPTVSLTVRASVVSISLDETIWEIGVVVASATPKWGDSDTKATLTNTGSVAVNVTIGGTDAVGANYTWTLAADGDPGSEIYGLKATTTTTYNITVKKTPFNNLVTDLPHTSSNTVTWSMTFYAPTAFNASEDGESKSATVTLVASAA